MPRDHYLETLKGIHDQLRRIADSVPYIYYPQRFIVNIVDDGFGNTFVKHGPDCDMEIVRPGKVKCSCDSDAE